MTQTPIVRQVDHILLSSDEPERLFALFAESFELPVAWPFTQYGEAFASGGVAAGNVNLECIGAGGGASAPSARRAAQFLGFAFDPEPLDQSIAELDRRGVAHEDPQLPHDVSQPWTNVVLTGMLDRSSIFLCEYGFDEGARREELRRHLADRAGGPVGVVSVAEIEIGVTYLDAALLRWERLLSPALSPAPGTWSVGGGPRIRLHQAERNGIESVAIGVSSLAGAREALAARGLLGDADGVLSIDRNAVQGLDLRFVEVTR